MHEALRTRKRSLEGGLHLSGRQPGFSTPRPFKVARASSSGRSWLTNSDGGETVWNGPGLHATISPTERTSPTRPAGLGVASSTHTGFLEETSPMYGGLNFTSPETLSTFDEYAANPRFLELQEELRSILFTGVQSLEPSRAQSPDAAEEDGAGSHNRPSQNFLDLSRTSIPLKRKIGYLKIWISECAPWLDMFDASRHFGIQAPIMAQSSPALLYGILALSARQLERKQGLEGSHDSLQLYQESISLLTPILEAKDPNVLVTACILCCLEMMSVSPRDWRRHVEGCAALFTAYNVNGFSGGLLQAVFWCYARMDLAGAIISDGAESTVLPISKWVSLISDRSATSSDGVRDDPARVIAATFISEGRAVPDMHANYAVYLTAKTTDLLCRRTQHLELNEPNNCHGAMFDSQWRSLWDELHQWFLQRPPEILPIRSTNSKGSNCEQDHLFPEILFAHWAAISSNQLYHAACIMMLEMKPADLQLQPLQSSNSPIWHARRVCGISLTNPHRGCLNNAIQPLFVAGRLLSHRSEHIALVRLIRSIEKTTGWGVCWRLKDLERAWGYDRDELSSIV